MWRRERNGASGDGDGILDEEILGRRAAVDPAAFVPLYRRYLPEILAFAARRLGDPHEAEDLAADVMRKAFARRQTFLGGSYRAWLYTIAVNTLRDHAARPTPPGALPPDLLDRGPGPEELALRAAERAEVRSALAVLPPETQVVVEMRAQGYPCAEVARALGRDADWVRLTHHRAMTRLARELGIARKGGTRG